MLAHHTVHETRTTDRFIRWTARIIGLTASLMWLFILIASLIEEGFGAIETEGMVLGALVGVAVIGVVVGISNEETGGAIALVAGIALAVFAAVTAGRNHWLAILVSGVPFMISGTLFMLSARRDG
jgi:hypothetical protein